MSTVPKYARGVAIVTVNGADVPLVCTPRAAGIISKVTGGLQNALNSLIAVEYEAVLGIYCAGSGKAPVEAEQELFDFGITPMARVLYQYVMMLLNGGRTAEERAADDAVAAAKRGNEDAAPTADAAEPAAS